jgi:hypothetical protein
MDILPLVVAAVSAVAIILIAIGLASGRGMDPVQARLSQLGTMQVHSLEELELQTPLFELLEAVDLHPAAHRQPLGLCRPHHHQLIHDTDREAACAGGQPR